MTSAILDGFINLNLLLGCAFGFWLVARLLLDLTGHARAFALQLSLLNTLFVMVLIGPVLVLLYGLAVRQGLVAADGAPNLSDFMVAQYLNGNISMRPGDFEWVLSLRDLAVRGLVVPVTWAAYGVLGLLVLGHLLLLARFAVSAIRLRRIIGQSYRWRRFGRLHLCLTDVTHIPFSTRGLRNHYIIIPTAMLSDKAGLQMAIAHEIQHIRQGDVTWEIGLEGLRLLLFWNPAFLLWKRAVDRLRELACDQQLLARRGFDPAAYSECLLRICDNGLRQGPGAARVRASAVGMVQDVPHLMGADPIRFLRYRITALLSARPPQTGRRLGLVILGPLAGTIAFSAVALQHQGDWSHDRLMLSAIVNLERLRVSQGY